MDARIPANSSQVHIKRKDTYRWRGGTRTVDLGDNITATIKTASVGTRIKIFLGLEKNQAYETVTITDKRGRISEGTEFKLSASGMRNRTKELETKLNQALSETNSRRVSSDPQRSPATSTANTAPEIPKPINADTSEAAPKPPTPEDISKTAAPMDSGEEPEASNPSSVSKTSTEPSVPQPGGSVIPPHDAKTSTSTSTPTDATPTTASATVSTEATIAPELQTTMPSLEEAKELAEDYCNADSSDKQKLEEKLTKLLDTLDGKLSDAATNPQEVKKIATAVSTTLRRSISTLKNSAPQELKNLQEKAGALTSKAQSFNSANTFIDNINNGKQQQFDQQHKAILQQAAMDTDFPRHEEALQALMSVVSQSCEKIQKGGFLSEATHVTVSCNPVSHLQYANRALKEIFAEKQSPEFTQLQNTIKDTISKACQEFCGAKDFSSQDITNLNTLKYTLPGGASMPDAMQQAFTKATDTLTQRITENKYDPNSEEITLSNDISMLQTIHKTLNDDSAECQAIEKTFFENLEAITNAYKKYPTGYKDPTAIEAIAQKHADRLSAEDVKNLASEYTQSVTDHGAQAENLKAQLKFTLKVIDNKLDYDFEHITSEDTQKLQTILQTLSRKDTSVYRKGTYQMMDAQLKALQVLQNANSGESDFRAAFNELENAAKWYGNITNNPLHKALKAKLSADTRASVPIQNLSQEALQQLDEETFKNLPNDAEKLTSDALQKLLDQTSIEDMTRYAEVYAAGFQKRALRDSFLIQGKLNVIAQAVGQKLLTGADQISSDDVQKLQVLIDKSRAYNLNINQSIQTATEAQLRVIQTLQDVQRNTTNSAIDNAFTLIDEYNKFPANDFFHQAINKELESNVESACRTFVGNLDQFTGNAKKLIDLYDKLPNSSPTRGIIRKTFADHHQEIRDKLESRGTVTRDELQTLEDLKIIAQQTT